ncbi:hypothetical protein GGR55DRAFT_660441 [Xylaria sp. FL0064]|nr:hypothetical protein GGR55DRAFT_660441 [Xylaria sp. FL0064]
MVDAPIMSAEIDVTSKIVNICGQPLEEMLMPHDRLLSLRYASTDATIFDAVSKPIRALPKRKQL